MIRTVAAELAPGHGVEFLASDWNARRPRSETAGGLTILRLRLPSPTNAARPLSGLLAWLLDLPPTLLHLRRLLRDRHIDVVHLHYAASYLLCFRLLRLWRGTPYVLTVHGSDVTGHRDLGLLERFLTRLSVAGAGCAVAVSSALAGQANAAFGLPGRFRAIHNGITQAGDASPPPALPAFSVPERFFLVVANVTRVKGPDIAIEAWKCLAGRCPGVHLVIVGQHRELHGACEAMVAELGLEGRVHMPGPVSREEVFALMGRAMGLVVPSRDEGLGYALLEAGSMGLAAVCADLPAIREIARDDSEALIVPPEDPGAIADAVVRLAEDHALRRSLGEALHKRVATAFSAKAMAQAYLDAYRVAIDGAARR